MGLLDIFKKKESSSQPVVQSSLDDLPPIPHGVDPGLHVPEPSNPSLNNPSDTLSDDFSADLSGNAQNNTMLDLPASPDFDDSSNPTIPLPESLYPDPSLSSLDSTQKPTPPESNLASLEDPSQVPKVEKIPIDSSPRVEVTHEELHNLPNFKLNEDLPIQRKESITPEDEERSTVRTESLLLKSIFVEKEHYIGLIAAVKSMKDDLQASGPQQRKIAHVDMKLAKEYVKLSTSFENFNENIMIIESILSNEKW